MTEENPSSMQAYHKWVQDDQGARRHSLRGLEERLRGGVPQAEGGHYEGWLAMPAPQAGAQGRARSTNRGR